MTVFEQPRVSNAKVSSASSKWTTQFHASPGIAWVALLVMIELGVVRWLSRGRFNGLADLENSAALQLGHAASKVLVFFFLAAIGAAVIRGKLRDPCVKSARGRLALIVMNLVGFFWLLLLLQKLSERDTADYQLEGVLFQLYAAAIALFALTVFSGTALVLPNGIRLSRLLVFSGPLSIAASLYFGYFSWALVGLRSVIEGTTLSLSLWFYGLTGRTQPLIDYSSPDPIMQSDRFAISIAPYCSGYQGMASAFIILAAYIFMERRSIHVAPALILSAIAISVIFVINALRIAILFFIGEEISPDIAVNGFHAQFGSLALLAISALAILFMEAGPFRRSVSSAEGSPLEFEVVAWRLATLAAPLAIYLFAGIVTGLFVGAFNWLYPLPVIVGAAVVWWLREDLRKELSQHPRLLSMTIGAAVFVVWIMLVPPNAERSADILASLSEAPLWLAAVWSAFRLFGASVFVPIVEELAFRAGLIPFLIQITPKRFGHVFTLGFALIASSVAFGILHSEVLAATVAGLAYGAIYLCRRSVIDAILAHSVTNFLLCLYVLGFGNWSYL